MYKLAIHPAHNKKQTETGAAFHQSNRKLLLPLAS